MRIRFHRVSDEAHVLEILGPGERAERVTCETRSYLVHDLWHYAVEAAGARSDGFWGTLAAGATLAEMNDRSTMTGGAEMAAIEGVVGALQGISKGTADPDAIVQQLERGGRSAPWIDRAMVAAALERMRRVRGHWRATPFGGVMELVWPPAR